MRSTAARVCLALALSFAAGANAMTLVGFDTSIRQIEDVQVVGDFAFAAAAYDGLAVYDVSQRRHPVLVRQLPLSGVAEIVEVGPDGLLYVGVREDGLHIFDISDPLSPLEVGAFEVPWGGLNSGTYLTDIALSGRLALLAAWNGGLLLVDVSDPRSPRQVGYYPTYTYKVIADPGGDLAYTYSGGDLSVIDISDPGHPSRVGGVSAGSFEDLTLAGDRVYAATTQGLSIVDVSHPDSPRVLSRDTSAGFADEIEMDGDRAFLAEGGELAVYDVSDPGTPSRLGQFSGGSRVRALALVDGLAYVGTFDGGLQVASLRDVEHPRAVADLQLVQALRITGRGRYAYVAAQASIWVLDLADPAAPVIVDYLAIPTWDLVLDGDRLYAAAGDQGLYVLDVSQPAEPRILGQLRDFRSFYLYVTRIAEHDGFVYIYGGGGNLFIVDASTPEAPFVQQILHAPVSGYGYLAVEGDFAWLSTSTDQLAVFDVSDPASLSVAGTFPMFPVGELAPGGGLVYHTESDELHVYEVQPSGALAPEGAVPLPTPTYWVRRFGDHAFSGFTGPGDISGAYVFDASDPRRPRLRGGVSDLRASFDAMEAHGLVYLATHTGVHVFDLGPEYQTRAVSIDVRPGSSVNAVAVGSEGWLPVAVLGAEDFDVADIDPETLSFGPAEAGAAGHPVTRDIDRDGHADLLARFRIADTGLAFGDTQACLRGETLHGVPFQGCDAIDTGQGCGRGFALALALPPLVGLGRRWRGRSRRDRGQRCRPSSTQLSAVGRVASHPD